MNTEERESGKRRRGAGYQRNCRLRSRETWWACWPFSPAWCTRVRRCLGGQPCASATSTNCADPRSGAVDGGKSDQGNVTLDGVDVNDQHSRTAFTSVLRVTLDSVQEFRTTTTNAGAEFGHSSGAQVTIITKSGTNTVHGSLYEFLRNTDTSANSFFSNSAGVPRAQLNRNVFGAAVGAPIKKDKLFYFANWEGRKDASAATVLRTWLFPPPPQLPAGRSFVRYHHRRQSQP